jgi:hypothetical protein
MRQVLAEAVAVPVGDGFGIDRQPRWSPHGDRIFFARSRPALGMGGLRIHSAAPDGSEPRLVFPDLRLASTGFDLTPALPPRVTAPTNLIATAPGSGRLSMRLGLVSRGNASLVEQRDELVLGIATQPFDGGETAGILLTQPLPAADPQRILFYEVEVRAAISRTDPGSIFRLALHNALRQRFDTVLEVTPPDQGLHTWRFATESLAHVSRDGEIRVEVIADLGPGAAGELFVDHIAVRARVLE